MSTAPAQPFPINTATSPSTQPQHSLTPESPSNPVHRQPPPIGTASRSTFPIIISRSGTHSPTPYLLLTLSYPLPITSYPLPIPSYLPLLSPTFPYLPLLSPIVPTHIPHFPIKPPIHQQSSVYIGNLKSPLNITEQILPDLSVNSSGQEPESPKPRSTCGVDSPVQ